MVTLDGNDIPVVAWCQETNAQRKIWAKQLVSDAWVDIGSGSAVTAGISGTTGWAMAHDLVTDYQGKPVVAWQDDTSGNFEIYVRRFDGGSWNELGAGSATVGGISNSGATSENPALASLPYTTCVAWQEVGLRGLQILLRCTQE